MEQDLISIGFDFNKSKKEADLVIADMERVITAANNLEKVYNSINLKGGFADSKKGAEQLSIAINDTVKSYSEYSQSVVSSSKVQEAEAKATAANEKAKQLLIKTERESAIATNKASQEQIKTQQEAEKLAQQQLKTALLKSAEANKAIALENKEAKAAADLGSDYKQLSLAYSDAAKKAKDYSIALGAGHPASIQAVNDAKDLHDRLLQVDQSVGQSQRNVGNYPTTLEKVGSGFKSFASSALAAIGVLGGIDLAVQAIRGIFNLNKELEVSVANLSAITGAEGQDLKDLTNAAIRLSTEGAPSARDYIEAMKLIGSAKPELLANKEGLIQVTEAAKLLSEASGIELPDAATRLTDALNQFGEPAQKAKVYVDALAAAAKFGAAEVPQITEALLKFGSIAKSSNINIYESAAAIELLAERGLKGADAGTALRNVFLRLSAVNALGPRALKELEAAGVNTSILTDKSLSLETRLKELSKIQNDATALVKVFGTENLNAGQIILQNIPRYAELAKQIQTTGVASEQAAANTDTLAFKWEKLKNLFVSPFLEGNNSGMKKFIDGLSVSLQYLIGFAGATKTALVNAFSALALGAGVLKDIATFDFSNIGKRIEKIKEEQDAAEKMIITQKELAEARKKVNIVAEDAARKPLQEQKELLNAWIDMKDRSFKAYNDLVSKGKNLSEEGHKANMKLYTDANTVLALQKLIADEQKATSATATEDPGAAAKKTKEVKHIKDISDAVADLRKELDKIQNNVDIGTITIKDADIDRVKAYQKAFDEIFDRGGKASTPIVQSLLVELNPVTKRLLARQVKDLENSLKPDKLEIPLEPVVNKEKAFDAVAFQDELLKNQLTIVEKYNFLELSALEEKHAAGKISEEEYQRQVFEIGQKYSKEAVKAQIASVQEQISLLKPGSEREDAEKRFAELQLKYNKIISDDRKKKNDELIAEIQQIQSVFNSLASLGADIVNIGVTNQKNSLQDLEDTRQKNYQQEVDRINASTLTEQQKADKIKVLDAQRQAQKEEFDRKNRQADLKKAAFDKQIAIMNIILNGALAVVKAAGRSIFEAIAVGALYAAQLVVAIATPIPHAKGLINNPKNHIGLVGEAGKEIVIIPGQKPVLYDKPTTVFLPKGADVINEIMFKSMAKQTAGSISGKNDKSEELLMELVNITRKNNRQTQRVDLSLKHNGEWEIYKKKYYS